MPTNNPKAKTVTVPRNKLQKVLEYLADEEKHYRQEPTRNHIWPVVKALWKTLQATGPRPFTLRTKPEDLLPAQIAAGPCPHCGRMDTWLNDIPMKAFCRGTDKQPHKTWEKVVPIPYNPNLQGYKHGARPPLPEGLIDKTKKKRLATKKTEAASKKHDA
jgi:hypothetical protein